MFLVYLVIWSLFYQNRRNKAIKADTFLGLSWVFVLCSSSTGQYRPEKTKRLAHCLMFYLLHDELLILE